MVKIKRVVTFKSGAKMIFEAPSYQVAIKDWDDYIEPHLNIDEVDSIQSYINGEPVGEIDYHSYEMHG